MWNQGLGQKVFLRDVARFHTAETQTHQSNDAAQALNTGLSGHNGSLQSNNNGINPNAVPADKAMNAYKQNTGIYD